MAGYRVTNLVGEFIKDKDLIGNQDPFVVFETGSTKVTTKVVKSGGTNPIWDDEYYIEPDTAGMNRELHIAVYNKNTLLPDGLLGRGNVTLDNGMKTVTLVDKKGNTTGQLTFSLSGASGGMGTGMGANSMGTGMGVGGMGAGMGAGQGLNTTSGVQGSDYSDTRDAGLGAGGMGAGGMGAGGMGAGGMGGNTSTYNEEIPGGERTVTNTTTVTEERGVGGGVCASETFTKTEDRPTVREVKNYILEHRPVEKEYIVETKFVGEKHLGVSHTEHINSEESIVQTTPARPPCADAPTLETLTTGNDYKRSGQTNACADGTCGI